MTKQELLESESSLVQTINKMMDVCDPKRTAPRINSLPPIRRAADEIELLKSELASERMQRQALDKAIHPLYRERDRLREILYQIHTHRGPDGLPQDLTMQEIRKIAGDAVISCSPVEPTA